MALNRISKHMIDQDFVKEVEDTKEQLAQTSLVSTDIVNIAEAGCIADAIQIDYTYSGTGTALDGLTRKIWISEGDNGVHNRQIIQSLLDQGKSLYVPEGYFYIDGLVQLTVTHSGTTITGNNAEKSVIIGASFGVRNTHAVSGIQFDKVTLRGIADMTPPKKLKKPTDPDFDPSLHYDLYDDQSFVYIDGGYRSNATWGCFVYHHDPNIQTEIITFDNVIIKDYYSGIIIGNKSVVNPKKKVKTIRVRNSTFDNIVFQPIGANNVEDAETENCYFKNIYFQPIDYSSGCIGTRIRNNTFDNCASLGKVEGTILENGERVLSDDFALKGNRYINPPDIDDVHFDEDSIISNLTGDGEVEDNYFEVGNRHDKIIKTSPKHNDKHCLIDIRKNKFNIKGSKNGNVQVANVFKYDDTSEVKGIDLTMEGNEVVNNTTDAEVYLLTNYGKVRNFKENGNKVKSTNGGQNRLYDGYLPEVKFASKDSEIDNVFNSYITFVFDDMFNAELVSILDHEVKFLPSTSLISKTGITFNNTKSTKANIKKVEIKGVKTNFPVFVYVNNTDIEDSSVIDNEIHVETNQSDIGQPNIIYRSNSRTGKFTFKGNEVKKGDKNLSFIPFSILSTGTVDSIVIVDNDIEELEYFARTSNANVLVELILKGNTVSRNGALTLLQNFTSSNVKKGYFSGNIVDATTFNANYFNKIRDVGNIIDATTINESNKVT